jgi:ribosomal protein S18 acetylase RimI-like enzyme
MSDDEVTIRPVNQIPWSDTQTVFGTRGDPAGCWCQYFKVPNANWREGNRSAFAAALCSQIENDAVSPGLVAYLGDEPVGWVAVEPRVHYPQLFHGKVVSIGSVQPPDDESVWAITCFVVRIGYRRRGLAQQLVKAAVAHAFTNGARVIEGYPVDVAAKEKVSAADLYHGTVSLFAGVGFTIEARPLPGRALMSLSS